MITANPMWGLIELVGLILLCLSSVPIAISMGTIGVVFAWLYYGGVVFVDFAGITAWAYSYSYTLSMIPLFVLMGTVIGEAGIGRDAFDCFYKWLSKVKGGLAIAATTACGFFGAITGSTAAALVTIGGIAVPEMKRYGYSRELRLGTVAVAGTLASLIPPSLLAIFYCVLTETSVGQVFIAGIIPGIILTGLFCIAIYIWVSLKPSIAPIGQEGFPLKEKLVALKGLIPVVIIFIAMFVGIYMGFFSPTEAAGIGVVYAIAVTLIMRRLNWQRFKRGTYDAVRITAFIMFLIIGAHLFAHTIALSGLAAFVGDIVIGLEIPPVALMFAIVAVFIAAGCVMDTFGMMVLFVPIFFPIVIALGYNAVWYGTLNVVLAEMAMITPPVAGQIYIAQALEPDESTFMDVVRGIRPFYVCVLILLALLIFFPQIALWLPSRM